jgi:hypothetical protein
MSITKTKGALRAIGTATYRIGVLALLLLLLAGLARTNMLLLSIGQMLYKVIGGPVS